MAGLADTVVCGVVRAESYDRAKKFYTEVLGLKASDRSSPAPEAGACLRRAAGPC